MYRIRLIFIYISVGLSFGLTRGQQIGNYVSDGSFEIPVTSSIVTGFNQAKFWQPIDSADYSCNNLYLCNNVAPYIQGFQYARTGNGFAGGTFFHPTIYNWMYPRNRLKSLLQANKVYCVKFYVNNANNSQPAIDSYGAFLADASLDTVSCYGVPLTFLTPQVQNPINNFILDTLNWTPISGTFVATGNEKYLVLGNFKSALATNSILVNPNGFVGNDSFLDDVSVIEINLPAYAGPDKPCIPGDSVFIGRVSDFATDPGCIWYKLPNMTVAIDTISGLWVKPTTTSTYVVRQELDCSPLKWDTVVIFMDAVGLKDLQWYSDNIKLFPNPTETDLTVTFGSQADIGKVSIINPLGQTIREEDLQIQKTEFTVPTSDLDKGIYLIQFKTPVGTVTKQFLKN